MKIAICDDESIELSRLRSLLYKYKLAKSVDFSIFTFQSSVELISNIQNGVRFNILFLDIIMPVLNGMDLANEIREYDKTVKIIFLTSSPDFAVDSYSVNAYYYFLKPVSKDRMFFMLDELFLNFTKHDKECLIVKYKNRFTSIPLNTLEYCEVINKTIIYHVHKKGFIESVGSIANLEAELLLYPRFIKPHRSYVINLDFVKSISIKEIILISDKIIPISRAKCNEIKQAFLEYSCTNPTGSKQ